MRRPLGYRIWWKPEEAPAEGKVEPERDDYERWALTEFVPAHRNKPITITVVRRDENEAYAIGMALLEQRNPIEHEGPHGIGGWIPTDMLQSKSTLLARSMLSVQTFANRAPEHLRCDAQAEGVERLPEIWYC